MSVDACCPSSESICGERILIFGGSGSLGKTVIRRWISNNQITNVSRDEEKQWLLKTDIRNPNLSQIVGDISDPADVDNAILTVKPTVICIFACLKHIDLCESFPEKAMRINSQGILNVHRTLLKYASAVQGLHTVLFVSTDKACMPMTTYGCSKAISEFFVQSVGQVPAPTTKWVAVRYGNVLNSSGSILPHLHAHKHAPEPQTLTHADMTRFIMTLDQSLNLIEYAICKGAHNEIIVPHLYSIHIRDMFSLFEEMYGKTTVVTGLRCKEKIHEDLLSVVEAARTYRREGYYHITPNILAGAEEIPPFDSSTHLLSKTQLRDYLILKGLL
jgi:UDP-N-acetylglucosamine 4,6-dehydratase